jgi:uncharacterized protein
VDVRGRLGRLMRHRSLALSTGFVPALLSSVLLLLLASGGSATAQELPTLTQPVTDLAHVIDAESATLLDQRIRALQAATKDAIAVATVDSFAPYASIEEYAVHLFERAGIGTRENDNGVLIVLAVRERRVRIEVGYGLEEFITDGFAGDTIRQAMLPAFRNGQYGPGLLAGTTRVIQRIAQARGVTVSGVPAAAPPRPHVQLAPSQIIFIIIVIIFIINSIRRGGGGSGLTGGGRYGGRTWSGWHGGLGGFGGGFGGFGGGFGGGGGGGGFGGFGGGRSGGGGASGGW